MVGTGLVTGGLPDWAAVRASMAGCLLQTPFATWGGS